MKEILAKKIHDYSEELALENDAHLKLGELYDAALVAAQASINVANQTSSIDERITSLANGLQSILDLILESRNKVREKKSQLLTKIDTVKEVLDDANRDNSPTAPSSEKKSPNKN